MKISECMSRDVQLASPGMSLQQAARLMAHHDLGAMPVGDNDRLVGMITDRDLAIRGLGDGHGPAAKVGDAMSSEVRWCYEDDDVEYALQCMSEEQVRRLPVLSRDKRLCGMVSIGDLTAAMQPQKTGQALCAISQPTGLHSQHLH